MSDDEYSLSEDFDLNESNKQGYYKSEAINTNLYGQKKAYNCFKSISCDQIKKIIKEPLFTLDSIKDIFGKDIKFDDKNNLGFVATEEAKIRVSKILLAAKAHINLLITGTTSSAKTFSVLVASYIFNQILEKTKSSDYGTEIKLLRKNLSEDTTRDDLIGSIIYDSKKNRFVFKKGDFTEAFHKGYWLLLDELSLAPPSVLQAIEAALDSKKLTVQEIGQTSEIQMNDNFFLVCTTNPSNEEYSRFKLSKEFLDRFHCINFDTLSNDEMAIIMKQKCKISGVNRQIQKIVMAHIEHTGTNGPKCKNMYTLRELDKACILLKNTKDEEKIIDILYRTRAGSNLITYSNEINRFFEHKDFIATNNRKKYGHLALDCLNYGFNIILESGYSSGTSYLAETIAKTFNPKLPPLIITMTNELHVSDLTEFSIPISEMTNGKSEMKILIKKGLVYKAMEEGRVVIINDLERGNTRVIESINDIYEYNVLDESTCNFQRPVKINKNFRLIFTLHSNSQNKLSAAFFNRFIHIKIPDTSEITDHFELPKSAPINTRDHSFPRPDITTELEELCLSKGIAPTSQISSVYSYAKGSFDSKIPLCIFGESGFGRSLGIDLMCMKYMNNWQVYTVYCTSETTMESLIGKYSYEGKLSFQQGPLLKAAINGGIIIFKNIDKLSYHAFSCIELIIDFLKRKNRELLIPGFDLSEFNFSDELCCLATIDSNVKKEIPRYIASIFHVEYLPEPTKEDYIKICSLYPEHINQRPRFIENLITCFVSCFESKEPFDSSFRMLRRMLSNFRSLCTRTDSIENSINIFAFYQNSDYISNLNLITNLKDKLNFDSDTIWSQINNKAHIEDNLIEKYPFSYQLRKLSDPEAVLKLSEGQLNTLFHMVSTKSPIIIVGPTSYKETLVKLVQKNLRVFNATSDSSNNDIIGSITFKKNSNSSGKFGRGEIYDMLIEYMMIEITTCKKVEKIDLNTQESFNEIKKIINDMNEQSIKPYFQYLIDIVEQNSDYATFFELGCLIRELLMGNSVLIKNVDQLNQGIIDSLIPFLNDPIDLNEYIPGISYHPAGSLFFTCTEQGYNKLSTSFKSRTQTVHIKDLGKEDIKNYINDDLLLDAYDQKIHDYTDIMRAMNIIKIAKVLNKYKSAEERVMIASSLFELRTEDANHIKGISTFFINEKVYQLSELVEYDEKSHILTSLRTGAKIKVIKFNEKPLKKIVYVPCVANLLDLCIISLATHIPLIIESSPGQNKSTLIRKLGKAIGKPTISTNMSKNRSSEEFIGQLVPDGQGFKYEIGDLYKYIEQNVIYLIDEINLANSSLLSQFLSVFKSNYKSNISHPHEKQDFVKLFDIIATMNPSTLTAGRTCLPHGFLSSSIIYKMPNYSDWENAQIISSILDKFEDNLEDFSESVKFIIESHKESSKQSNDVTIRDLLKLAEAFKHYLLENYKEIHDDMQKVIPKDTIASFVQLVYSSKIINNQDEFLNKVDNYKKNTHKINIPKKLTKPEFILVEQMKDALKLNRGIIIRGPSGCGKTHCIKYLSENGFDGKKHRIRTIQLCAESDISELFGRFEPYYPKISKLIYEIKESIAEVLDDENITSSIRKKMNKYLSSLFNKKDAKNIVETMRNDSEIIAFDRIKLKINKFIAETENKVRFVYKNSPLVEAMENGDWIILDNINLCPGDILESLNSLLEESHTLRITKGTQDACYSMNPKEISDKVQTINPDFRLIMTSDDRVLDSAHILPAPFLSRCIVLRINQPAISELPKITRNYFDVPIYADFFSCCFIESSNNHVRDIIRMAHAYQIFNNNKNNVPIEVPLGKTIKYILNNDHSIPKSFIIPEKGKDEDIKEILCIIQTNLFNEKFSDDEFHPLNVEYIIKTFSELKDPIISDELQILIKMTLKLACYIFAKKENIKSYGIIHERIITFLACGYLITCNTNKPIPDFIWELKFKPAIWDLLFINKNEYTNFTKKEGFLDYIKYNDFDRDDFDIEFYNYSGKKLYEIINNTDKLNEIVNSLFSETRKIIGDNIAKKENKSSIIIDKLPIAFPSIPDNRILDDNLTYYQIIELLQYINIEPPFDKILSSFNFDSSKYTLFSEFGNIFYNTTDPKIALMLSKLLEYDSKYNYITKIFQIDCTNQNYLDQIDNICDKYNINLEDLNIYGKEIKEFCSTNEMELSYSIIEKIDKTEEIINNALLSKRNEEILNQEEKENYNRAINSLNSISNDFIKENIKQKIDKSLHYDSKFNEYIQEQLLLDKRISKDNTNNYIKYNCKFLEDNYCSNEVSNDDKKFMFSVIITSFIVPSSCQNFTISANIYDQIKYFIKEDKIQKALNNINRNELNKNNTNYSYLDQLYCKIKSPPEISISDLNSINIISKIINLMNKYHINTCLISDSIKPKPYISKMQIVMDPKRVEKSIKHIPEDKINEIIDQYAELYEDISENNEDTNFIQIEELKEKCPSIPIEDFGESVLLSWSQPYTDDPIKLIAHYLTEKEAIKANIENIRSDSITLNNKKYMIFHIEELLTNLINLKFIEIISESFALKNDRIIDDIFKVNNLESPQQVLKKDMIIHLSQIMDKQLIQEEKRMIKKAYRNLFSAEELKIDDDDLHIIYSASYRGKIIDYNTKHQKFIEYKDTFYSRDKEIQKIVEKLDKILEETKKCFLEISATYKSLLKKDKKSKKSVEKEKYRYIINLADLILTPYRNGDDENIKYIQIFSEGKKIYSKIKNGKKNISKIHNKIYTAKSLDYDLKFVAEDKYPTFKVCYDQYNFYNNIEPSIIQIKKNIYDINNIDKIFSFLNMVIKCQNQSIKELSDSISNIVTNIKDKESGIKDIDVKCDPEKPKFDFDIDQKPFQSIYDILMIGINEGNAQLLNNIHYDLGNCSKNSLLRLNISNLANVNIKTCPPTKITQNKDSIVLLMDINKENNELQIKNNFDDSLIGCLKFKCNLVDPELYFMFSIPVSIQDNVILIQGLIYKKMSIAIHSNSLQTSHFLKLETLKGSELAENEVKIFNKNNKITFKFRNSGKFKARMQIFIPLFNINIFSTIDIDISMEEHTFMYDAITLKELSIYENIYNDSYVIVKSPKEPKLSQYLEIKTRLQETSYLHLVHVKNSSNIKSLYNTITFTRCNTYYDIELNRDIRPKSSDFKNITIFNKYRYFIRLGETVKLYERIVSNLGIKLNFKDYKLDNIHFYLNYSYYRHGYEFQKCYDENGLIISYMRQNEVDLLINQIKDSQNIQFDKKTNYCIPWINIIRLFDDNSGYEIEERIITNINPRLKIKENQTYYIKVSRSILSTCSNIPQSVLKKHIKQDKIKTIKTDISKYEIIKSINPLNLFDIISHFTEIKSGLLLYRQFLEVKSDEKSIASILSQVYRVLELLNKNGIMIDTFSEIVSIGDILFKDEKCNSRNIEIIHNSRRTESYEDIRFKYYRKKEKISSKITEPMNNSDENPDDDNEGALLSFNNFNLNKSIKHIHSDSTYKRIYKILTEDEVAVIEKNRIRQDDTDDKDNDEKDNNNQSNIAAASIKLNTKIFDESKSTRNAFIRGQSLNSKLYELSNIEQENTNLFLPNGNIKEGNLPNFNIYVFNILETLMKSSFSISIPHNHITLLFDISVISGSKNKNILAMNMMVTLHVLNALGIEFSVWMFADRNLCFCVKKPTDVFDKSRQTLILDSYNLDRINPDSYVLSSISTVSNQEIEKDSKLFIIFSTFVSSQILTPHMKWEEIASICLKKRSLIGFIEPCQYIDKNISDALESSLKKSDSLSFIKFKSIHHSIFKLIKKIFIKFKNNSIQPDINVKDTLNIKLHKFKENNKYEHGTYICKNAITTKKTKNHNIEPDELKTTKINGKFEIIKTKKMNFGDLNFSSNILYPNKATKYELSSHGYIIDIQGLINSYFSNFTNMNIFKEKTGEKIRQYSVDIIVDSSNIVKLYSANHCFISTISLLESLKELEIPSVNLIIAGSSIVPLLVDQDLKFILRENYLYSKIYSTLIENASESRSLEEAIKKIIAHSIGSSIPHVLFVITDALISSEQENNIKDLLSFAQLNGTAIIGIGTGPIPYKIEDIFTWSVFEKNPYKLREALWKLTQSGITRNIFRPYNNLPTPKIPDELPNLINPSVNSDLLKQFSSINYINISIYESVNPASFDESKFTNNYLTDTIFDACKDGAYKGYKILVMMFYQGGMKNTPDEFITEKVFRNGPPNMPENTKSPGDKFNEKGFEYFIVNKYKDALEELVTGEYSIAMLCTASKGIESKTEDDNYLEPFLEGIVKFFEQGGALIMFGENPPFIFEINLILERIKGITVRIHPKDSDLGGGIMTASKNDVVENGEFQNCHYKFNAKINGIQYNELYSLGGGLQELFEGKTLAKFINIDDSFTVFSKTKNGNPSCIYRIPKEKEGVLFLDSGASKIFNEYVETGAARYINNLAMGCIHYSNFRISYDNEAEQEGIKVDMAIKPKPTKLLKKRDLPLLITIIIDATGSMRKKINSCKEKIQELIDSCKIKVDEIDIYLQFVAYRDICDINKESPMIEKHEITSSPENIQDFIEGIKATGGGDDKHENISAGFEAALYQIEKKMKVTKFKNVFILIGDSPNHHITHKDSCQLGNERKEPWIDVWHKIDNRMRALKIEKLITISCNPSFEKQYGYWEEDKCDYINSIIDKNSLEEDEPLDLIFVYHVSDIVAYMYK